MILNSKENRYNYKYLIYSINMRDINATVIVNLIGSEKNILKSLHKDARWGIKKAQKSGLSVREAKSEKDWTAFYELLKEVVRSGGSDVQPFSYIRGKAHTLLVCEKGQKIIGGAAVFFDPVYNIKIPRLFKIASDKKYLYLQPNNLLYWHCVLWAKKKGYREFDFGGWQINARGHLDGINRFKEKWGKLIYHHTEYPFFRALGRKLIRNSIISRLAYYKLRGRKIYFI